MTLRKFWALIDADDTILGVSINGEPTGTANAYRDVLRRYSARMEREGFSTKEAMTKQQDIDMVAARVHGFGNKSRFPTSLRQAYEQLATARDGKFDGRIARQIEDIGWSVFTDYPYVPLPGALKTLEVLSKEYQIAIVTKGEDSEQRKKIFDSGCFVYADQVIVMATKNLDEWDEKVVRALHIGPVVRKFSWAIGNSVKSDVNPPLLLGFNGLLVGTDETWKFESAEVAPAHEDRVFARITSMEDSVQFLMPHYTQRGLE